MEQSNCSGWILELTKNNPEGVIVKIPQICNQPEYKPVIHAHWIDAECSHCHKSFTDCVDAVYIYYNPPYCPECGATMDEKGE